jgi:hypothetical protein
MFFSGGGTDVQVAMQEAKNPIGFTTDVVDVIDKLYHIMLYTSP